MVCHRRAGKTVSTVNDLIIGSLENRLERPQHAYIAPFRDQAKRVAWSYLKHYSEPFWASKPNESELSVYLFGDRKISLFGADNPDALRGIYLDGAVLDEFGDFKPGVWGNVIRPALSDRRGWAVFGGTPKGRNEFWQVRELARKSPDEWLLLELRASESKLIAADELDTLRRQLSPEQYAQEYECDFAAAILGAYWGKEMSAADREGRLTEVSHDASIPVYTAWDIGRRDDTAIWWYQILWGEIHVIDFHASSGADVPFYASIISGTPSEGDREELALLKLRTRSYRYKTHYLPHDARAKTLASGGKSVIEQLGARLGLSTMEIVPDIGVQDGIQAGRVALARSYFDATRCEEGIEALRQYQREWDDEKKAFREKPRHDWTSHPADAYRMLAVSWQAEVKPADALKVNKDVRASEQPGSTFELPALDRLWKEQQRRQVRY